MKKAQFFVFLLMAGMAPNLHAQFVHAKEKIQQELTQVSVEKNLSIEDLSEFIVTDHHVSKKSGVEHIYLRQSFEGIEILGTESSLHFTQDGKLVSGSNNFVNSLTKRKSSKSAFALDAVQAVQSAASHLGYAVTEPLTVLSQLQNADKKTNISRGGISLSDIPARLVYMLFENGDFTLAWDLSIEAVSKDEWYSVQVDAATGRVINKHNLVNSCGFTCSHGEEDTSHDYQDHFDDDHQVSTEDSSSSSMTSLMTGTYNVFAMPLESPLYGNRTMVTGAVNTNASPYGWHDTNGSPGAEYTITRGNNVFAYDDIDGNNNNNPGFSPNGGAQLTFNYTFNPVFSTANRSLNAAITNLFYWNNIIHDVAYEYGFDEASGNFQQNNYGKGGSGGDYVRAEAQDGGGTCNANFATPVDGQLPRMQMYVCNQRDGDFDNLVIVHEYAHGISNRLTGGRTSICLQNNEQMGEGWSDWYGLMLTMKEGDTKTQSRTVGTYLFGQDTSGPGIRAYPYNTDMAVNPPTDDAIKTAAIPHGVGSVWAMMLWEMTWGLIDAYGFDSDIYSGTGGNNMALAIVTEALKIQPCSPGFVSGRNAILAADQALYGGVNTCIIWQAFAKRGLGYSASQGSSNSTTDGTQAFNMPNFTAAFTGLNDICESAGVMTNLSGGTPAGGIYSGPGVIDDGNGTTYTFDPMAAGVGTHTITYSILASTCGTASSASSQMQVTPGIEITCPANIEVDLVSGCEIVVNYVTPEGTSGCDSGFLENFDLNSSPSLPSGWSFSQQVGTEVEWKTVTSDYISSPNALFANNPGSVNLASITSPYYQINGFSQLTFRNRYIIETGYDGAVLEYSINGTGVWQDILSGGGTFVDGGYTHTMPSVWNNPLVGRLAWSGNSGGFVTTTIDLDPSLDGATVMFRWRIGTDNSTASTGIWIDNVEVTGNPTSQLVSTVQIAGLPSGSAFPVGTTTNIFQVDDGTGNLAQCSFDVIINDNINPTIQVQNITVQLDQNGQTVITPEEIDNGSFDNCSITSRSLDKTLFTCSDVGQNTVTLTVFDGSGNWSSAQAIVTVEELENPVAIGQNMTVQLDQNGQVTIAAEDVNNGSSDNCSIASMTISQATFTCNDIGVNTITLSVYDASGNVGTTQVNITVEDVQDPIAIGQDIIVSLDEFGQITITAEDVNNGSSDNCSIASLSINQTTFTCDDVGPNTVILLVEDTSGNTDSVAVIVTVSAEDSTAPTIDAMSNQTVAANTDCEGILPDYTSLAVVADNCDTTLSVTQNPVAGSSFTGSVLVTITVTDSSSNSASTDFTVSAEDSTAPTVITQNIVVSLDISGQIIITPEDIDNGSYDNCGVASMSLDESTFTCADIGANTVVLTVVDINGNFASQQATVTVLDTMNPIVIGQNITIQLNENGVVTITPSDVNNGSFDNCGIASMSVFPITFTCNSVGDNIVTLTVFDTSGNFATAQVIVTVEDITPPEIECPDDLIVEIPTGTFYVLPDYWTEGLASAEDNCTNPVTILTQEPAPGSELSEGDHTIILTASDEYGNISTCIFVLTVDVNLYSEDLPLVDNSIILYPNPTQGDVMIINRSNKDLSHVLITDVNGRIIKEISLNNYNQENIISLKDYASGVYFVRIFSGSASIVKSIIRR